ncbi:VanZ family protein [Demequina sp. NBRC 110053]|uniref:VanZ family protein n=1 Tax=Demequina sp. NBRC 110053 TaxID=1570342 RepID=UPI000A044986|nr:VanZ family protein [Demequina sp. NBRC 110053]
MDAGRRPSPARTALLWLALVATVAVIAWLTVVPELRAGGTGSTGGVNLVPGTEIDRGLHSGAGGPRLNLVGNVIMFVPLGALVALLVRAGFFTRVLVATVIGALLSVGIEATQYAVGRVADVDDVILNAAGAFAGGVVAASLAAASSRSRSRPTVDGA